MCGCWVPPSKVGCAETENLRSEQMLRLDEIIPNTVRIAPCLVAIMCAGEPRPYRAAKSPNSGGLARDLLPQNWGLACSTVGVACALRLPY